MRVLSGTVALVLLVAGCGGGGSSGGGQPPLQALEQTLVVQMDQNGDSELDLVTLDISETPFVILECLYGMPGGDFDDVTPVVKGQPIDPAVSGALATFVGGSFGTTDRAELDVTNSNGDQMKVVVFEADMKNLPGPGGQLAGAATVSVDEVKPECAAPGDAVLLKGSGFGEQPTVHFNGTEAEVLRAGDDRIVCRVPSGLAEGDATIDVNGTSTTAEFHVLAAGAPAIVYTSSETATPGMLLFFVGARLKGATADFLDSSDVLKGTVDLKGGSRVAYLKVPEDLPTGSYTIVITNDSGDSGHCSPLLDVVEPGEATLTSIEPLDQLPGRPVLCKGNDLGPVGFCFLTWTDTDGNGLFSWGFANGYDRVHTWVPGDAQAGATYDVVIDFADGSATQDPGFSYTVGTPAPPEITELEYDKGPAGSLVGISGHDLLGSGYAWPTVEFTRNGVSTEALIYYAFGGFGGFGSAGGGHAGPNALQGGFKGDDLDRIVVEVPRDLEDGDYEVTVTVSGQTSNKEIFTVGDLELTVTSMSPDGQGPYGPRDIVVIEGTGFGVPDYDFFITNDGGHGGGMGGANGIAGFDPGGGGDPSVPVFKVTVTWKGDAGSLDGTVLWHTDREILVFPPGGWEDPLPVGDYTVSVTVEHDDGSTDTADAGPYTVKSKDEHGGGFPPFPMTGVSNK